MFRQQNLSLTKSGVPGFYSVHTMIEEEPCHSLYLGTMIMFEGDYVNAANPGTYLLQMVNYRGPSLGGRPSLTVLYLQHKYV